MSDGVMPTIQSYAIDHDHGHRTTGTVVVNGLIPGDRPIVQLHETWFHPQGGGQKADRGTIGSATVIHVDCQDGIVNHYVDNITGLQVGGEYNFVIDEVARVLHTALHSAGHLIAAVVNQHHPALVAKLGHHWPGQSRVEFEGDLSLLNSTHILELQGQIADIIGLNLPVAIVNHADPLTRAIQIEGYEPIPCGGTHVRSLQEIGNIVITSIKKVRKLLRISYTVN